MFRVHQSVLDEIQLCDSNTLLERSSNDVSGFNKRQFGLRLELLDIISMYVGVYVSKMCVLNI